MSQGALPCGTLVVHLLRQILTLTTYTIWCNFYYMHNYVGIENPFASIISMKKILSAKSFLYCFWKAEIVDIDAN